MPNSDKKTLLFWILVLSIFFIVFLFWLPMFLNSVQTIVTSVGKTSSESTAEVRDTVAPQIDELKKTFEALMKELPAEAPKEDALE